MLTFLWEYLHKKNRFDNYGNTCGTFSEWSDRDDRKLLIDVSHSALALIY